MTIVTIAYASGSGHTKLLAENIMQGAKQAGDVKCNLLDVSAIQARDWEVLNISDAIVFGSPTYMGGVSGSFKQFMDETSSLWEAQNWADKVAAGFTIGTRFSGDKLFVLQQLSVFAAQHGMIWVGQNFVGERGAINEPRELNGDGSWLGLMATSSKDRAQLVPEPDLETAKLFGERVAKAVLRWTKNAGES